MGMRPKTVETAADGCAVIEAFAGGRPYRVGVLIYPGSSAYDMSAAAEVFSTANSELRRSFGLTHDVYIFEVIAPAPGPLALELGLKFLPDRTIADTAAHYDTLLVNGGTAEPVEAAMKDSALIAWLRARAPATRRLASLCTGAFLLAEAGILQGSATTHWAYCDRLRARFPKLDVNADQIYVREGNVYSSAGSTAAMDLALGLVEEDLGRPVAMAIARRLVMFLKRAGGQSQFSSTLIAQSARPELLGGVPEWILGHLTEDLAVEALAARAAMSPRNFARVFVAETGLTPAKYVERARVERARMLIEETNLPLATIAGKCGFDADRQMRRAFLRWLKVVPSDYAARFRAATPAPQTARKIEDNSQPRLVA